MRIAILGATSQIARDLIVSSSGTEGMHLHLFARRANELMKWLNSVGLAEFYPVENFPEFINQEFDAVINFVGVGNPAKTRVIGNSIFDTTMYFDNMAVDYVRDRQDCRYIFLSSGAAYGSGFGEPVDEKTKAIVPVNNLQPHDWYGVTKLYAECRHRSFPTLPIIDIRIFNYFSYSQDISARFFISEVVRAIQSGEVLLTSPQDIVRDYIGPGDFYDLILALLDAPPSNDVVDCYSKAPVRKFHLLEALRQEFGLQFSISENDESINATGVKMNYYSKNKKAESYGYLPKLSSEDLIVAEIRSILERF